jgi:hypothetical protein
MGDTSVSVCQIYSNILHFLERTPITGNEAFVYVEAYKYLTEQIQKMEAKLSDEKDKQNSY